LDEARAVAEKVGYPILLKAESGGGGRGMRVARSAEELEQAWNQASAEALAAFGDRRLDMEKLVEGGRHVEIQIMADRYGNVVHLGERDCTVQRMHQKLIEESPAPVLDQIRVAAGHRLSLKQDDIVLEGHAIECRINAENPSENFRPSPGVIEK